MRVLIAEDDAVSRRILEATLQKWGYEVVSACDGDEAWRLMQSGDSPRLVILDWMMPGMDGIEICHKVRNQTDRPYIYILLLSSKGQRDDMVAGLDAGADDYIIKPFDPLEMRGRLRAGQRIVELQEQLLSAREELQYIATHDSLTRLWNRPAIIAALRGLLAQGGQRGGPVAVAMADVDHFKKINDTYGHTVGDAVLYELAQRMIRSLRPYDAVGRYGGEEFLIVFEGCGPPEAFSLAERLRKRVGEERINVMGTSLSVTISMGVAVSGPEGEMDHEALIHRADAALYLAKNSGRNRVVSAPFTSPNGTVTSGKASESAGLTTCSLPE
jgi:two-component system cell cycle response regulator